MDQATQKKNFEAGNDQADCQRELLLDKISCCIEASRNNASREELIARLEDIRVILYLTGSLKMPAMKLKSPV